jgi:hypothetical protein
MLRPNFFEPLYAIIDMGIIWNDIEVMCKMIRPPHSLAYPAPLKPAPAGHVIASFVFLCSRLTPRTPLHVLLLHPVQELRVFFEIASSTVPSIVAHTSKFVAFRALHVGFSFDDVDMFVSVRVRTPHFVFI